MSATVLVNPRKNVGEYTKYSFPSKIMEYLSSGVPAVAYKLDGIPSEYDGYINYVLGDGAEEFAKVLTNVCECKDGTYSSRAINARDYVLSNKCAAVQAEKILKMLGV